MTILGVRFKAADDRRDADVSFEDWLPEGDSIVDATADSDSEDLIVEAVQVFGETVKVWISGGLAGKSYTVSVVVTTAEGRIKRACLRVRVTGC